MVELKLLVEIEDLNIHNFVSLNKKTTSATFNPSLYTSMSKVCKPKSKKESKPTGMTDIKLLYAPEIEVSTADNSTVEIEEYDTEVDV